MSKDVPLSDKIIGHCMGTPVVCTKIIKDVKEAVQKSIKKSFSTELIKNNYKGNELWIRISDLIKIFGGGLTNDNKKTIRKI